MLFKNTFLLTWGLSYIGSYIIYLLLKENNKVVLLDSDKSKKSLDTSKGTNLTMSELCFKKTRIRDLSI